MTTSDSQLISWTDAGETRTARWRSENGSPPPTSVVIADDTITADKAHQLTTGGTALLWRGDFPNARQLLDALDRRLTPARRRPSATPTDLFHLHRQDQARRARVLGMVLVPLDSQHQLSLRRAPDVRLACTEVYGPAQTSSVTSLRELLGIRSAHEWHHQGVHIPELDERFQPHYGVFSPVRGEYVRLVAEAPLTRTGTAFDICTGTGVLAAVLARRGVERVVATDSDPRAVACARENLDRLGFGGERTSVQQADLFPAGRADLVVCNPPWLPTRPTSPLEHAVYDPGSRMLHAFLDRLGSHLNPGGEGWLVLSDLAEHLGLRSRGDLLAAFQRAGLAVLGRSETTPEHPRASEPSDPLHTARAAEVTSLWRLAIPNGGPRNTTPTGTQVS